MFEIYMPHQNLGCLGIRCGTFYADLYFEWGGRPRLYVNWFRKSKWTIGWFFARRWRDANGYARGV